MGFVILRHVNSVDTNRYWQVCYANIRKHYPDEYVVIVDDNSNSAFVSTIDLHNAHVLHSDFPKRGELLMYYYYLTQKWFETAVFVHDSVILNRKMDFSTDSYKFLWHFDEEILHPNVRKKLDCVEVLSRFEGAKELVDLYQRTDQWYGCFGGMAIIRHSYLLEVFSHYNIGVLLDYVQSREERMMFERVISILLASQRPGASKKSLLGSIFDHCPWGASFEDVHRDPARIWWYRLPIIKYWSGR